MTRFETRGGQNDVSSHFQFADGACRPAHDQPRACSSQHPAVIAAPSSGRLPRLHLESLLHDRAMPNPLQQSLDVAAASHGRANREAQTFCCFAPSCSRVVCSFHLVSQNSVFNCVRACVDVHKGPGAMAQWQRVCIVSNVSHNLESVCSRERPLLRSNKVHPGRIHSQRACER